jgi:hypothetical protein
MVEPIKIKMCMCVCVCVCVCVCNGSCHINSINLRECKIRSQLGWNVEHVSKLKGDLHLEILYKWKTQNPSQVGVIV